MKLESTTWLLTGASGGIGSAIAAMLAGRGAALILVGRSMERLKALRQTLHEPSLHRMIVADLQTEYGLEQMMAQLGNQPLDGVINNAGVNRFGWFADRSGVSLHAEINLNLMQPILLTNRVLGQLKHPGMIVNIGSTFGAIGYPGYATYCASKAGVQRFSEALDRELSAAGIRVLYLAPRATATALNCPEVQAMNRQLGNHEDPPEKVAEQLYHLIVHEERSRFIGWPEKLFARVNQLLPGVVAASIRRQFPVIADYLERIRVENP